MENQINSIYRESTFNYSSKTSIQKISLLLLDPLIKNVVNSIISSTVTPEGLNLLMKKGELSNSSSKKESIEFRNNHYTNNFSINLYYESLNIFILSSDVSEVYEPVKFRFAREGITHWRLISVEIPINQLIDQPVKE